MEAHGFGAILAVMPDGAPRGLEAVLAADAAVGARCRLASLSHEWKFLPQQMVEIAPAKAPASASAGHGAHSGGEFRFPGHRHRDRGIQLDRAGRAVSLGRRAAARPSPSADDEIVLHRSLSGDQCGVQEVSGCHADIIRRRSQFPAGLAQRNLSGGLGQQAGDLGVAGRCARLRGLGRQTPAA